MNAPKLFDVVIETDQGKKHPRGWIPDAVPEAPVDERMQSPGSDWPADHDGRHFETFAGGEGI
jgi:hypothetical protein